MKSKQKKAKKRHYFLLNFVKVTGFPAYLWLRPKIYSFGKTRVKDVKGGAIVAANHTSFIDPIAGYCIFWRRNLHLVATKDLFASKFGNFFFTHVQVIKVDKENFAMSTFHEIKEVLEKDKLVMIFPEGKVNTEKQNILPFKSGAVLMAHKTGKPIIPMYMQKGKRFFSRWRGVIGDPIDVRALCGAIPSIDKINSVCELLKQKEEQLKEYFEGLKK